jgi:hypothetical protein
VATSTRRTKPASAYTTGAGPAKEIRVSGFPTSGRRHREARTTAEAAILARTGTAVSGRVEDQNGVGEPYDRLLTQRTA